MPALNITTLKKLADEKNLLGENYLEENFQPSSYDLRIGTIYYGKKIISTDHPDPSSYFVEVKPSEIITMHSLEEIEMPNNCCGNVFALNNHSSTGLLILNPGHVDPGYIGPISICAINLSRKSIKLSLNDKIFTLIVEKLDKEVPQNFRYKNKKYDSRKDFEEKQYKNRFSNLSNSFFDLVVSYKEHRQLLAEVLYSRLMGNLKGLVKIIGVLAAIAGILRLVYAIYPDDINDLLNSKRKKELEQKTQKINSLNEEVKVFKDSVEILNDKLEILQIPNNRENE